VFTDPQRPFTAKDTKMKKETVCSATLLFCVIACIVLSTSSHTEAQEMGDKYLEPTPPTILVPEAPSFAMLDAEVDDFLQILLARTSFQVTGKGLAVAVIDSGINTKHIMFSNRLIDGANFSEDGGPNDMRDTGRNALGAIVPNGHGSNVAGIIAGAKLPPSENMPTGIAHEAKIVPLKVFPGGSFSKINEALQWIIDNRDNIHINHGVLISVVNMSLGIPKLSLLDDHGSLPPDILQQKMLIKKLRQEGVAVVVSAGNSYASFTPNKQGMSIPAIFSDTVSVAAIYDSNFPPNVPPLPRTYADGGTVNQAVAGRLTVFSQRLGDNSGGDYRTDICGPGFFVTSAGPDDGMDATHSRTTQDGTSQAGPTISGLILLGQQLWRDRMFASNPGMSKQELPSVDLVEQWLRNGGVAFQDQEDSLAITMDNVTSCGDSFVYANAVGFLKQVDSATPSDVPTSPVSLQALQAELYGKSAEDQKKILGEFKNRAGIFEQFNKR
jgi:subtilisin family serine protease